MFEGKVASEHAAIVRLIRKRAPNLVRVGLESGSTSVWLTHALKAEGLAVVCLDARHAQAVLSVRANKSNRGDARGLAEMVRVGWFKAVQVKRFLGWGRSWRLPYIAVINNPKWFAHSRDVGAYLGMTPKRYQSGEVDQAGRIPKCGDRFARTCVHKAAGVWLTKVDRWSPLKAWRVRLMQSVGATKAKVAVARKLTIILHRIWIDGIEFRWTKAAAAA